MAFSKQSSGEYSLSDKSSQPSDEESSPFLPGTDVAGQPAWGSREKRNTLFMALLCVAALMAGFFGGFTMGRKRHYSLDEGASMIRATDFGPTRQFIKSESVTFTGSPMFLENGTFAVPNPGPIRYVGTPSREIDEAWEDLTRDRYFRITEQETISAFGDAKDEYWNDAVGGYMAGLDMFHALHCLNQLRMSVWPDYYPKMRHVTGSKLIHREHCIDHIRQIIMCGGDMTLVPTVWTDVLQRNYVHSDVPHSCRDFRSLREFIAQRGQSGTEQTPESDLKKHQ